MNPPAHWPLTARQQCLKIIARNYCGDVRPFLQTRQPDLGDETGADLLEYEPEKLLSFLIDRYESPLTPPIQRKKSEVDHVLSILDELAVENLRSENYEEKGAFDE